LPSVPRIRRVDCSGPGLRRVRHGRGFRFLDRDGHTIKNQELLDRLRALAIPPAWTDVWICADPLGHIQATGHDDAGRKQYLYHEDWQERRAQLKFDHVLEFGRVLPELRRSLYGDLERRGLVRERVLAAGVRLLDLGFFRIGGEEYTVENDTYGLATLRQSQMRLERRSATFTYRAKGGATLKQVVSDPVVLPTLRELKRRKRGGHRLLTYWNARTWTKVRSDEVNEYLKGLAGEQFTAKDFRTWNATVLAAVALAGEDDPSELSAAAKRRAASAATKRVARYLFNTPSVCRTSYIDPRAFDRFDSGETIAQSLKRIVNDANPEDFADREKIERAVRRLLS
jgi:DNA topoisomerase-1